jgi:hypothetical protein
MPATLMEFLPLRRISPSESTPPRIAKPGYVPSSGFLTLSTACSSPERPALFHAGNARGVLRSPGAFLRYQVPAARRPGIALLAFSLSRARHLRKSEAGDHSRGGTTA